MNPSKLYYRRELAEINIKMAKENTLDIEYLLNLRTEMEGFSFFNLSGYATYILGNYYIKRADYKKCYEIINEVKSSQVKDKPFIQAYILLNEAVLNWYDGQQWDLCIKNCDKIIEINNSMEEKDNLLHFLALLFKGTTYSTKKDDINAYRVLWESLHIDLDEIDHYNKCKTYQWLGVTETNQGNYDKAVEFLTKSLEVYKEKSLIAAYADALSTLGVLNLNFKKINQAIENFQESLDISKRYNLIHFLADAYYNLGMAYVEINENVKAELNYLDAIDITKKINDMIKCSNSILMLGSLYTKMGQFIKAEKTLFYGLELAQKHHKDNHVLMIKAYNNIAEFFFKMKDYKNTLKYIKKSEKLCLEKNFKLGKLSVFNILINYYKERKNYKNAFEYSINLLSLKLEIQNEQARENLELLNLKNETDRMKQEFDQKIENEKIKAVLAMAVTANHEINQPLTVIQLSAEMLKADRNINSLSERQMKHIDKIENEIEKIFNILNKYKNSENFLFDNYVTEKTKIIKFD